MCTNNRVHYDPMAVSGFFFAYHTSSLSSVLNSWNACQVPSVSSVRLRWSQFSQLYFMQYTRLCVFSSPFSLMMIVRMCVLLSYYHHQTGSMTHLQLFRVMQWNNVYVVCLFIFLYHLYITHSCPNFNDCLANPPLRWYYGLLVASHNASWYDMYDTQRDSWKINGATQAPHHHTDPLWSCLSLILVAWLPSIILAVC